MIYKLLPWFTLSFFNDLFLLWWSFNVIFVQFFLSKWGLINDKYWLLCVLDYDYQDDFGGRITFGITVISFPSWIDIKTLFWYTSDWSCCFYEILQVCTIINSLAAKNWDVFTKSGSLYWRGLQPLAWVVYILKHELLSRTKFLSVVSMLFLSNANFSESNTVFSFPLEKGFFYLENLIIK